MVLYAHLYAEICQTMQDFSKNHIWLVYDGECPLCSATARAMRIRAAVGTLHIINARETSPIVTEINQAGISLDEGMVVKFNHRLYQGADAQHLLAMIGSDNDWFNRINVFLFRHKVVAKLLYPILKTLRHLLLIVRGKSAINNLDQKKHDITTSNLTEPIFQSVFADKWEQLPSVLQKHYMIQPYSHDHVKIKGKMNIDYSSGFSLLMPLFKFFNVLVPYRENNIPVIVYIRSNPQSTAIHFDRTFYLSNKKPYQFNSYMVPIKDNSVIEMMKNKIAWRIRYSFDGKYEILQHDGYVCSLFGKLIPLPLTLLLGRVNCYKEALSDNTFSLHMEVKHFLLGKYSYTGIFTIVENENA